MEMISLRDPKLNVECKKKLAARMAEWNGETESRLAKSATFPSTSDTSSDTTRWSVSKHSLVGPRPLCRIISTIDHTYWSLCIELNDRQSHTLNLINKLVNNKQCVFIIKETGSRRRQAGRAIWMSLKSLLYNCKTNAHYSSWQREKRNYEGCARFPQSTTSLSASPVLSCPLLSVIYYKLLRVRVRLRIVSREASLQYLKLTSVACYLLEYASCFYVSLCTCFLSFCLPSEGNDKCK